MKYQLTQIRKEAAQFTVKMRAEMAGESWVIRNPGTRYGLCLLKDRHGQYNEAVYIKDARSNFIGFLAYAD